MRTKDGREYVISEDGTVYLQDEDKKGFTALSSKRYIEPGDVPNMIMPGTAFQLDGYLDLSRVTHDAGKGNYCVIVGEMENAIQKLGKYEDIGKSPEELQEILYTDNVQISLYQQENADLHRQIEKLKAERQEIVQKMKAIHDAVIELDGELNL